jgi:hypothetical protein
VKRAYPIDQCNYIRYTANKGWEARKGVSGWWQDSTEDDIRELCAGANADKMDTAMVDPNRAVPISTTHGFVVTSNKKLKNEFGLAIATNGGGQLRLCSAHAAYNIARNVRSELQSDRRASQARFEMLLPGGLLPIDDPSVEDVKRVLLDFGISATRLYNISPRVLVNFRDGLFLLRIQLTYEGQAEPGFHLTVYHAASGAILDPDASDSKSIVVNDDDRVHQPKGRKEEGQANKKAMRAFRAAFPVPSAIHVAEVYRCERA